ncbi:hypothetical protein AURDEDRAFT_160124 [Auricularia subglabra TFB-10046 SS5]|nr:hypothetical protein AURDEDRAFT_160124 [Auricularia subglabra TFB-10046 SS5]
MLVLTITDPFAALQDSSAGSVRTLIDTLSQRKEMSRLHVRCLHLNHKFYNHSIVKLIRAAAVARRDSSVSIEEYFLIDEGRDWTESVPVEDSMMNCQQIYDSDADGTNRNTSACPLRMKTAKTGIPQAYYPLGQVY